MATAHTAKLRAKAARLAAEGLSGHEIARRTGVSESTVRRWRAKEALTRHDTTPDDAHMTHDNAPLDAPTDAPTTHDSTPSDAPVTRPTAPPAAPPDTLTVALNDDLRYHLGVLAAAGHDTQTAITTAITVLSDAYAHAWDYGLYGRGTIPAFHVHVEGDPWPRPRPCT